MTILVYLESYDGELTGHAKEEVGMANEIATHTSQGIVGIAIDSNTSSLAQQAGSVGITELKLATIDSYNPRAYAKTIENIYQDGDILIFPTSTWGHEIAAYLAMDLEAAPITDIVEVRGDNKYIRSTNSNGVLVTVEPEGPKILSCRQGVFSIPEEQDSTANVTEIAAGEGHKNFRVKQVEPLQMTRVPLSDADIIVTAGRGVGSADKIPVVEELVDILDAALGATRAIVDDGWVDPDLQIGQTGKTVSPRLYIACGVSGAIQHITGMKTSDVIVAINTDEEAPIFDIADYGLVADLHEVIPEMVKQLKAMKQ